MGTRVLNRPDVWPICPGPTVAGFIHERSMSDKTSIQYVDTTVNPVTGCDGCELWSPAGGTCYAAKQHDKFGQVRRGYSPSFDKIVFWPGRMAEAARLSDLRGCLRITKPWLNGLPRLIFVSDMGDALSEAVTFEYLKMETIQNVISPHGRRHNWCWLTKRPHRMAKFSAWLKRRGIDWPTNLWTGTTVTSTKTTARIDELLEVGDEQTIHYLSVEPQWERIDLRPWLLHLDWIIQGGESGGSLAKRFQLEWAEQMQQDCAEAGVPYFLKQLGSYVFRGDDRIRLDDDHGGDWYEWPSNLKKRQIPALAPVNAGVQ